MLLRTWVCEYLFRILISILLGKYPEGELLDHMTDLFLIFLKKLYTLFHSDYLILHSHQQCTAVPIYPQPHQHLLFWCFLRFVCLFCSSSQPNGREVRNLSIILIFKKRKFFFLFQFN